MQNNTRLKLILILILCLAFKTQAQIDIKFMTFNIWHEGTSVSNGLIKIRDIIADVNPDIVGFQEINYNGVWTTKIINLLSAVGLIYHKGYAGGDISIISKFPISEPTLINYQANSIAGFKVDIFGSPIIVVCAHLDYMYSASYLPRGYNGGYPNWGMIDDGTGRPHPVTDINQILAYNLQSKRDEQISDFLNYAKTKTEPIILIGDFNEPSYLDWTANTVSMFDHHGLIIPWQNTRLLADSGYVDAYRSFFPNEVSNPGITWPSFAHGVGSTSWTPLADERDRIDYILYKGNNIKTKYVALVGPRESYSYDKLTTTFTSNENFIADTLEWPSDHKAVFATLNLPIVTNINEINSDDNFKFSLENNYPNPFNPTTQISYSIPKSELVSLKVYDVLGKEVAQLVNQFQNNGNYQVTFNANQLSSGVYFYQLKAGDFVSVKKMLLVR